MAREKGQRLIADNRRARHEFELLDSLEAGIVLTGPEVKSLRAGKGNIQRAFAYVRDGELWLVGSHIAEYPQSGYAVQEPERDRKLLVARRELDSLAGKVQERGLTLVPTRMYFRDGRVKVEIALARGKDVRDKRRDIAERDAKRHLERVLKGQIHD
jgi:SsrA-binding protein